MKKTFNKMKDFFSRNLSKLFGFYQDSLAIDKMQKSILILILKLRAEGIKLLDTQKLQVRAQQKLNDFLRINSNLPVEDLSVDNINARKRIKNRIRATAFADGVLGLMAITILMKVFINVSIAWLPAMLIGGVVAYWLLLYSIESKVDEQISENTNTQDFVGRFVYIIPLLFIPAANLFVVFTNPGNPVNILLISFLVLTLLLNFSTARYYRQYKLMKDTEKSLSIRMRLTNERDSLEAKVIGLKEKVNFVADQIIVNAFDLKKEYTALNPKPALALSIDKQMFINDQIYHEDIFPINQIRLTKPTGELAELSNIWMASTRIELPLVKQTETGEVSKELNPSVENIYQHPHEAEQTENHLEDYDAMLDNFNPNDKIL